MRSGIKIITLHVKDIDNDYHTIVRKTLTLTLCLISNPLKKRILTTNELFRVCSYNFNVHYSFPFHHHAIFWHQVHTTALTHIHIYMHTFHIHTSYTHK